MSIRIIVLLYLFNTFGLSSTSADLSSDLYNYFQLLYENVWTDLVYGNNIKSEKIDFCKLLI